MEMWLLIFFSLVLSAVVVALLLEHGARNRRLPPGPPILAILGNFLYHRWFLLKPEAVLRELHARYGSIITVRLDLQLTILIADRTIAHKALVERGAFFSDRPAPTPAFRLFNGSRHIISSSAYGPIWRLLRRNLTSEILHPARVKLYAGGRAWVLGLLTQHLRSQADSHDGVVVPIENFQFAMFCLLCLMCFGEKLDEKAVRDIKDAQRSRLLYASKLRVLNFVPCISRHLFRNRLKTAMEMGERRSQLYLPLIEARKRYKQQHLQKMTSSKEKERFVVSYVDSLLDIELPEEGGRKLSDNEVVSLCSEFLTGGTDTTSTALQWIMANLKAVIMEGLRRHPPAHFLPPRAVTEDVSLCGYLIPREATVNFFVAGMNWDEKAWEEPMEFKPERFLGIEGGAVDITGSREIKMMPFGAGRRICPGLGLARLHLQYFVANLVRRFEWKAVEGEEVDLSEKVEFAVVMKNPLRARLIPRRKT